MEQILFSIIIALMAGSVVVILVCIQEQKEKKGEIMIEGKRRYSSFISPYHLPAYVLLVFTLWPILYDSISEFILKMFSLFLHIGIYHSVLLVVMPLLRKKISAKVCSLLWMLPTMMYGVLYTAFTGVSRPWLVIPLPNISFTWLCVVWGVGFVGVMVWKIGSHLRFRRWILSSAEPVTDPMVLRLWEEEQWITQVYQEYKTAQIRIPIVQSERIATPLTTGLHRGSIYMVLPMRSYTEEEYRWIFRHELTHIGREDSGNKFFFTFCTAMCWFNPLMWIAMRQCASDFERSCDEMVLRGADGGTKKLYAYLLLKTAGDDRGFSTCLSASGTSMRYRLESIMGTTKRYLGSVVAGIFVFFMFVSYGVVSMSYDSMTAGEAIYYKNNPYQLSYVETDRTIDLLCVDNTVAKSLRQYISEQRIYRLTNSYAKGEKRIVLRYANPSVTVSLTDRMMEIRSYEDRHSKRQYYFTEPLDWSYLYELLGVEQ